MNQAALPLAEPRSRPSAPVRSMFMWPKTAVTPLEATAAFLCTLFVFILYSRLFDVVLSRLHVPLIISMAALMTALLSGRFVQKLKSPTTTLLIGLTVWMFLSTALSVWRVRSLDLVTDSWLKNLLFYVLIVVTFRTVQQVHTALRAISLAFLVVVILGLTVGGIGQANRWALPVGVYANPNEFAFAIVSGLIMFWIAAVSPGRSPLVRIVSVVVLPSFFYLLLKSESRGAAIAAVMALGYLSLKSSLADKLKLVAAVMIAGGLALGVTGGAVVERFGKALATTEDSSADGSTTSRIQLLRNSIYLTFANPIFGAGPGMFATVEDGLARDQGDRKGLWKGTHNTYTEFSSEVGIPAFLMFIAIIYKSFGGLLRVEKRNRALRSNRQQEIQSICQTLQAIWVIYLISFMFFHLAFSFFLLSLIGLTTAAVSAIERDFAKIERQSAQAAAA